MRITWQHLSSAVAAVAAAAVLGVAIPIPGSASAATGSIETAGWYGRDHHDDRYRGPGYGGPGWHHPWWYWRP